ncbi:DUF2913 family protein [Vibrio ruber]|uniref:DUF2913 family protein n=1 Tax=Vibrio ruber TaxID=184755 RepID=UPI00289323E1|nr:DUF2913 family protein [Vibrio ruber]WNJ97115.1 DUF2913 family protein [Vibrio ruber]
MMTYHDEIQRLVNTALAELAQAHQRGQLVNAPVANNHFLVRWVTNALKQQRFHRCVGDDLTRWQKAGRSQGNDAALERVFQRISAYYRLFFAPDASAEQPITDQQIELFLDTMTEAGWEISTSEPLVGCGKVQLFTASPNSLALCAQQCEACFDGSLLTQPMSFFVRGNHAQFVELAWQAGFMVHKQTDYKSNVKYHGEYWIYPGNRGKQLAEIPLGFQVG